MKITKFVFLIFILLVMIIPLGMIAAAPPDGKGPPDMGESAGNNLSYPVIWAEDYAKPLREPPLGMEYQLDGAWWYWWGTEGTDPNIVPLSCALDPDSPTGEFYCDDGLLGTFGDPIPMDDPDLVKAYLQKDELSTWQADNVLFSELNANGDDSKLYVDFVDWGDNLESVDWYTRSQVRTEVVLFQDLEQYLGPEGKLLEYEMRHTSGWGINEVHGLAADHLTDVPFLGPGTRATVYSHCARLTIQKLLLERGDTELDNLIWVPEDGWTEPEGYEDELINDAIFNLPVHAGGDGPGYYSAEINVKGRVIYGYTWNVRRLNEGAGDYRITFSFDETCGAVPALNTFFKEGHTEILIPIEEAVAIQALDAEPDGEEPGGGASGVLVPAEFDALGNLIGGNLTYIDVRILERGGGGGGGGGGGSRGGGGGGGGGGRHP